MKTTSVLAAMLPTAILLAGCGTSLKHLPHGDAAYTVMPAASASDPNGGVQNYEIGPFDVIDISVFQEPDLSVKNVQVDAAGRILFPLIGSVTASGQTATSLSAEIARQLGARFLENPQVSVVVTSSVSQKVTVSGSVVESGVFEIKGRTTLLEAVALAKGTSRTAALNQITVFLMIDGQEQAAVFDLSLIRAGRARDPLILGNDVIVVGFSNLKAGWRDFLSTVPLIAVFRPFN